MNPAIPVVLMTAYSSVETAVDALRKGAYDYLTKPFDFDELRLALQRATEHRRLKEDNRLLREALGVQFDRRNIIGSSPVMTDLMETVAQVRSDGGHRFDHRRIGNGKRAHRGGYSLQQPQEGRAVRQGELRGGYGKRCSNRSCSGMKRAPLPAL